MASAKIDISLRAEGKAVIVGNYIDLSDVRLIIEGGATDEKDLKKLDLYYNNAKIGKLDFNYSDGVFTFDSIDKVKLDKNKFNKSDEYKLEIKLSKLGIRIEIPYSIQE